MAHAMRLKPGTGPPAASGHVVSATVPWQDPGILHYELVQLTEQAAGT